MTNGNAAPRLTLAMDLDRVEELSADLERIAEAHAAPGPLMRALLGHFKTRVPHYHWAGIYLPDGHELHLGPYAGAAPPQARLPLPASAAAAVAFRSARPLIVADLGVAPHPAAGAATARSEIAVPIRDGAAALAVIVIDSDQLSAFNEHDQALLERAASLIAGAIHRSAPPRWPEPEPVG